MKHAASHTAEPPRTILVFVLSLAIIFSLFPGARGDHQGGKQVASIQIVPTHPETAQAGEPKPRQTADEPVEALAARPDQPDRPLPAVLRLVATSGARYLLLSSLLFTETAASRL